MATEFRCERCGRRVSVEASGRRVSCPHCKSPLTVPPLPASLPRPKVPPHDQTDVIPALRRAFRVLRDAPAGRGGKVICLLTDGEFHNNGRVVETMRRMDVGHKVRIHTILHHYRSPGGVRVLRRIALDNAGRFRFVGAGG